MARSSIGITWQETPKMVFPEPVGILEGDQILRASRRPKMEID